MVRETYLKFRTIRDRKKINVILPEDYKEFLLKVNVGIPKEQYLSFFIDDLNEEVIFGTIHLYLISRR
ncbi:SMI1/KNR4 family protein [Streptococcus sp. KHUD_018]